MATRVDVPMTGESVDLTDPTGAVVSFAKIVAGIVILGGGVATAQWAWNRFSETSPDIGKVEVL